MLGRLFLKWAEKRQRKDLEGFLTILQSMNHDEIGFVCMMAADVRNEMEELTGQDWLDPFPLIARLPELTYELSSRIGGLQRSGQKPLAAAVMVWIHTFRGTTNPQIRNLVRLMWMYLSKGFDYLSDARIQYFTMTGRMPNLSRAEKIPIGFEARHVG